MDISRALVTLLVVGVLGIQGVGGSYIRIKYFGGHSSGCSDSVEGFALSKGDEVDITEFTKHGKVCIPGSQTWHPFLEHENVAFVDDHGKKSEFRLDTGVTENFKATVTHYKEEDEWILAIGNKFQMIVRDCALMVIYHEESYKEKPHQTLGLAPHGTFKLPHHGLACCGGSCLKDSCTYKKGFSKGLKSQAYPKPDYGCDKIQSHQMHLPSTTFWDNVRNKDTSPTKCQTDLNLQMIGEQWPSSPINSWYATGCFGTHLSGEVRLPASPAHGCASHGRQRSYHVCIEHDDFVRITIGDKLFEYQGDFGPTKELTPYKSCRYFSFDGEPKGDMWLPIQIWYSGSGFNRYSHLSVSVLPLLKCTSNHHEEKKVFCKPCGKGRDGHCCEPLGPCDLRYYGECYSSAKTDKVDHEEHQIVPTLPKLLHTNPLPQPKITKIPARASCLVGGGGSCATAIAGKGFSDGKGFDTVKEDAILMCCKAFLSSKQKKYSWRPSPVVWEVKTVEYNGVETPWISLDKSEGKVEFDDYRKPICNDAVLKFTYHSEGLSPGSYVATIHIVSRSADDGEWEKEDDVPIEIHLLVTEKPAVKIQNIKLNHDKDGVHFAASIDTIHNKLFIDKDNIYLSTDDEVLEQAGVLSEVYPYEGHLVTKGWFPVKDPFHCQENHFRISAFGQLHQHHKECGAIHFAEDIKYCYPPTCRFYATDASYSGDEGLTTDKSYAEFLLVCTQEPKICRDCITVHGPDKWRLLDFAKLKDSASSFFLRLDWDPRYYGPIYLGITNAVQYNKGCSLELPKPYICGKTKFTRVTNVEGIEIKKVKDVAVHPLSFKINYDCYGKKCASSHGPVRKPKFLQRISYAKPTHDPHYGGLQAPYVSVDHDNHHHDHDKHLEHDPKWPIKQHHGDLDFHSNPHTSYGTSQGHWGPLAVPKVHTKGH